jgi:hypothetical protein
MVTPGVVPVVAPGFVVVVVPRPGVAAVPRLGVVVPTLGAVEPGSGGRLLFGTEGRPSPRISLLVDPAVPEPIALLLPVAPVVWASAVLESAARGTIHRKRGMEISSWMSRLHALPARRVPKALKQRAPPPSRAC